MTAKRRQAIKREGYRNFCPDMKPDFRYGGRVLKGLYDRSCYLEGWHEGEGENQIRLDDEQSSSQDVYTHSAGTLVNNPETTLHNTGDLKRIAALENALKQTNAELSGAIDEVNNNLKGYIQSSDLDDPNYWDKETCHNNQALLEGQGK